MKWAIGLDVGGTKIAGSLISDTGENLQIETSAIPTKGEPAVEAVMQMAERLIQLSRNQGYVPEGIGIAVPGAVDIASGIVQRAPNLNWEHLPLKDLGEKRLGLPIEIELDVRAAALGAMLTDLARGIKDFIYVTIGTGIGAGIVVGGELYYGHHSSSGEIGHCVLVEDGPSCGCGQRGCFEALAAGPALADRARRMLLEVPMPSILSQAVDKNGCIDPKAVFEAAQAGDPLAIEVVRKTAEYIGRGFSVLINLLNPEKIIVGGGVAKGGEYLMGLVRQYTSQYTFHHIPKLTQIVLPHDLDRLPIFGAANLIFRRKIVNV